MTVSIQINLPQDLVVECRQLINEGRMADMDSLIIDALHRYLQSSISEISEADIREDIEWGLHGQM